MAYTLTYSYANQAYTVSGYTGTPDNVVIPETYDDGTHGEYPVTSIGYAVFYMCSSLKSVTIGNNVTSIGDGAFAACSNLTNIIIPNSVTSLGTEVFYNCTSLTSVTIGNGVTSIGYATFRDCSSLTSITIPDSVTSIGSYVFSHCSSLTSITIANSVTNIGLYAFYYCTSLTNITIPDSVTSIGEAVFAYCSSLQNIILLPNTPPTVGMNAIVAVSANAKFYCYKSSENAYKTATNWNSYASKIIGDDIALYFAMNANSTKEYVSKNYLMKTGVVLSINDTIDNIQAILTSNDSTIIKGNLSAIISSDACDIGDENTDKNGRQTIISSKSSKTNGNDTAIIAARESKIISDDNSHSTESAIIGGYFNIIEKVQRAVIAGGSENTIAPELGSDALYGFIGGGQNNQVKHRNSATIGGQHLITTRTEQVLVGRYNDITLVDVLFAVGNGTAENNRSNAMTVYNDGMVDVKQLSMHKSLVIFGGDGANDAKIALDQSRSGQITDSGTKTLFGFTSNGATDLKVGSSSYQLVLRGSSTNFTYNGNEIPNKTYVDTGLSARVPITRTIAGIALSANISADDLTSALFTITEVTV